MLRRVLTLTAGVVMAGAAALAVTPAAQAAAPAKALTVVDVTYGPTSIGDYCYAKVSSSAFIGFYESGGLRCYARSNTGLAYAGSGSPYSACEYLTRAVVLSAFRGSSDALVCRVDR